MLQLAAPSPPTQVSWPSTRARSVLELRARLSSHSNLAWQISSLGDEPRAQILGLHDGAVPLPHLTEDRAEVL